MNQQRLLPITTFLAPLIERFANEGFRLYLVGGAVRDLLLKTHIDSPDIDLTTDAHPDQIYQIASDMGTRINRAGIDFGTVALRFGDQNLEITTHRAEAYVHTSRKPEVRFSTSILDDLARRDFTMNAMAIELTSKQPQLIDPYRGIEHLYAKELHTPLGPRISFTEDPLRMLRAARFIAKFSLTPSLDIEVAAQELAERLQIVSPERLQTELNRLLSVENPSSGLWFIIEHGLAEQFLPELPALALEQDPIHRHKDVLAHTIAVVAKCTPNPELRLAALLHDIGKPATRTVTSNGVNFHFHDVVGARMAKKRLQKLRYPSNTIERVSRLIELHLRFHTYAQGWSDAAVRRYVRDAGSLIEPLNELTLCDATTRNDAKLRAMQSRMQELQVRIAHLAEEEELASMRPPLNGEEVMAILKLAPSRSVGEALSYLTELRIERGPIDHDQAVSSLLTWWENRNSTKLAVD
ncbi:MAG: CCA tRNA nucleotidyltransferase [Ferrimicrobium sp.]